ncbi:MAG: MazG family protein [Lachnospiraceae bacterium]
MKKTYTFDDFCAIIARLRAKDGCPWDKEQTHASLRPCMMEEAAELVSSIRILEETNNPENMIEELGDVLLQVVMHAQIAKEENLFAMDDVLTEVSKKMVRRHPHVFGTLKADTSEKVLNNWEDIKKKEKEGKDWIENPLREIPPELPALRRAEKVLKKIDRQYEPQKGIEASLDEIMQLCGELKEQYRSDSFDKDNNGWRMEEEKRSEENRLILLLLALTRITSKRKLYAEQLLTDGLEDLIRHYERKMY